MNDKTYSITVDSRQREIIRATLNYVYNLSHDEELADLRDMFDDAEPNDTINDFTK